VKLPDTPGRMDRHPPHLGEHAGEVLRSLGYDEAHLAGLEARGIVGLRPGRRGGAVPEPTAA